MLGYLAKYVGILGKVCGDTWQSMWRYLAKYVEILGKVCGDTKKQGSQGMIPRLPRADYIKRIALS